MRNLWTADGDHQRTGSAVRGLLTQDDLAGLGVADGRVRWRCRSAPRAEDRPDDDQREPDDQAQRDRLVEDQGAEQESDGRVHVAVTDNKTGEAFTVNGDVEYMACNDQMCLPPLKVPFAVEVPALTK